MRGVVEVAFESRSFSVGRVDDPSLGVPQIVQPSPLSSLEALVLHGEARGRTQSRGQVDVGGGLGIVANQRDQFAGTRHRHNA